MQFLTAYTYYVMYSGELVAGFFRSSEIDYHFLVYIVDIRYILWKHIKYSFLFNYIRPTVAVTYHWFVDPEEPKGSLTNNTLRSPKYT